MTVCDLVQSSGAGFIITAVDHDLGEANESEEIPTYNFQMQVDQTITFVSQGIVMPRGKPSQPSEPEAGDWLFDDTIFQLLPNEKNPFDNTQVPITLKALRTIVGQTRIRFVGNILGYDRKYDILIEIIN
ncbi:unnamed protein product [Adineta steineri]|uniref:Uncharacterized protein n=1 Tax=Adineta steineri TaxID=433720 RepID=A0A813NBM8_9BILA|nr:unnamed protein product [Adineta steineri]CAF0907999.1 unnamed protein product [Adineta steineri]